MFSTRNIVFAVGFLVVGAIGAILADRLLFSSGANENRFAVSGSPPVTRIVQFQDWNLICPPPAPDNLPCTATSQRGGVLSLAIGGKLPGLQIWVPHGVVLTEGLAFSIGDAAPKGLPYETCLPQGCLVLVGLDSETLKALQSSQSGSVVVMPANGQPVSIPFSLKGFTDAYGALEDAKDQQDSMWNFLSR